MPVRIIKQTAANIKLAEKDIQYKFWGGISLFVGGGILVLILQLIGLWPKLQSVGYNTIGFQVPVWFMLVGAVMLVGVTVIKLYQEFKK